MSTSSDAVDAAVAHFRGCLESGLLMVASTPAGRQELVSRYLAATDQSPVALDVMLSRRSAGRLTGPPPAPEQIQTLVAAAATVPDHGRLRPWRFVVVTGDAQARFAAALSAAAREDDPLITAERAAKAGAKAHAAPATMAVIAVRRGDTKVPEWEQTASACCAGYAITLAAHATGLGAVWKTVPFLAAAPLRSCFTLDHNEQLLGWINLGHAAGPAPARPDVVDPAQLVSYLAA